MSSASSSRRTADDPHDAHDARGAGPRRGSRYERTQRDFREMPLEQQAAFVIEAAASVLARGLEHIGRRLAEELDAVAHRAASGPEAERSKDAGPGPAEPETAQRTAPRR